MCSLVSVGDKLDEIGFWLKCIWLYCILIFDDILLKPSPCGDNCSSMPKA